MYYYVWQHLPLNPKIVLFPGGFKPKIPIWVNFGGT
jgi:hypothetical protein